jgi:hypothetical protein
MSDSKTVLPDSKTFVGTTSPSGAGVLVISSNEGSRRPGFYPNTEARPALSEGTQTDSKETSEVEIQVNPVPPQTQGTSSLFTAVTGATTGNLFGQMSGDTVIRRSGQLFAIASAGSAAIKFGYDVYGSVSQIPLRDYANNALDRLYSWWTYFGSPTPPVAPAPKEEIKVPDGGPPSDPLPDGNGPPKKPEDKNNNESRWWKFLKIATAILIAGIIIFGQAFVSAVTSLSSFLYGSVLLPIISCITGNSDAKKSK